MSNVVVGGIFVIVGVLISLLGQIVYDGWRNRKRVTIVVESVRAVIGRTTTYFRLRRLGEETPTLASGGIHATGWVYATSAEADSFLVLSFVLNVQNASQLDDAVVTAEVSVRTTHGNVVSSSQPYAMESRFYGASILAHGYAALQLDFALAVAGLYIIGDGATPVDVPCILVLRTIRGQQFTLSTKPRLTTAPPRGNGAILPQPGLPHYYSADLAGSGAGNQDDKPTGALEAQDGATNTQ
jgi:hypothetical protein